MRPKSRLYYSLFPSYFFMLITHCSGVCARAVAQTKHQLPSTHCCRLGRPSNGWGAMCLHVFMMGLKRGGWRKCTVICCAVYTRGDRNWKFFFFVPLGFKRLMSSYMSCHTRLSFNRREESKCWCRWLIDVLSLSFWSHGFYKSRFWRFWKLW